MYIQGRDKKQWTQGDTMDDLGLDVDEVGAETNLLCSIGGNSIIDF